MLVVLVESLSVIVVLLLGARVLLLYKATPRRYAEPFDGVLYRLGDATLAERRCPGSPRATVIAIHGFTENAAYFSGFYAAPDIQLITLACSGYHVPFDGGTSGTASWAEAPAQPRGTIEYDAAVVVRALEHLPQSRSIRVHGHSRGGAVAIEAAAMRPDLFRGVEVALEAPLLPQAATRTQLSAVSRWFLPFVLALWRLAPISKYNRGTWGRLDDPRKRALIKSFPFNAVRISTLLRNVRSMDDWRKRRSYEVYEKLHRGVVLIADDDRVLDSHSMRESAAHAHRMESVEVRDSSHFVLLDQPHAVPPVAPATVREERTQ